MRQPYSAVDGQPAGELVLIFQKQRFHVPPYDFTLAQGRIAAIAGDHSEELVVARPEDLNTATKIVLAVIDGQRSHAPHVVRAPVILGNHHVGIGLPDIIANVVGLVEVVEGRNRQDGPWADDMQPGKIDQIIALVFYVPNTAGLLVRVVGHLVVVAASGRNEAKLVLRSLIECEGSEGAEPGAEIVQYLGASRLQPQVRAIAGNAGVVSEAVGVVADAELIFGAIEAAIAGHQLGLAIALETGAGHHVKDAVGAVAVFRGVAATLHFEVVNVLGIELRPDVGSNIRVGHWNAVNQPRHLVSATNVKLVVHHVGAGHVI